MPCKYLKGKSGKINFFAIGLAFIRNKVVHCIKHNHYRSKHSRKVSVAWPCQYSDPVIILLGSNCVWLLLSLWKYNCINQFFSADSPISKDTRIVLNLFKLKAGKPFFFNKVLSKRLLIIFFWRWWPFCHFNLNAVSIRGRPGHIYIATTTILEKRNKSYTTICRMLKNAEAIFFTFFQGLIRT